MFKVFEEVRRQAFCVSVLLSAQQGAADSSGERDDEVFGTVYGSKVFS